MSETATREAGAASHVPAPSVAAVATDRPTPQWLLRGELAMCPCGCIGRRKKGLFIEKTLGGSAGLLRQVMFSEDMATGGGLLQRVDPRVKLLSLLVLLVAMGLVHNIEILMVGYAGTLLLAFASRLPLGLFVKRGWLFGPIFTAIMVLPATLSIVIPGDVAVQLWTGHGQPEGLTVQGLTNAALIVARVACSISLVMLLTLTTTWVRLLAALGALGVPRIFVLIIGMAYRYIFLLLGSVTDMYEARKARTVGAQAHDRLARAFLFASAGTLFGKAHNLSEEVHQAMVARGYRGNVRTIAVSRLTMRDAAAAVVVLGAAIAIYGGDRFLGR